MSELYKIEKWVAEIHEQWSKSPTEVTHSMHDVQSIPSESRQEFYDDLQNALEELYPDNEIEIATLIGEIRITKR